MQKLGFLKIQEATGSLSGPIYSPINAGRNTAELMFRKQHQMRLYFILHRSVEFSSRKGWEQGGVRCGKHTKACDLRSWEGGEGGLTPRTYEQSRAGPEHFQLLRNTRSSSQAFPSPSVHTPGSEDRRGLLTRLTVWSTGHQTP